MHLDFEQKGQDFPSCRTLYYAGFIERKISGQFTHVYIRVAILYRIQIY